MEDVILTMLFVIEQLAIRSEQGKNYLIGRLVFGKYLSAEEGKKKVGKKKKRTRKRKRHKMLTLGLPFCLDGSVSSPRIEESW